MLPEEGQWYLFVEEYWPWVGGICKCLGANALGFPGVNPPPLPGMAADKCIMTGRDLMYIYIKITKYNNSPVSSPYKLLFMITTNFNLEYNPFFSLGWSQHSWVSLVEDSKE